MILLNAFRSIKDDSFFPISQDPDTSNENLLIVETTFFSKNIFDQWHKASGGFAEKIIISKNNNFDLDLGDAKNNKVALNIPHFNNQFQFQFQFKNKLIPFSVIQTIKDSLIDVDTIEELLSVHEDLADLAVREDCDAAANAYKSKIESINISSQKFKKDATKTYWALAIAARKECNYADADFYYQKAISHDSQTDEKWVEYVDFFSISKSLF